MTTYDRLVHKDVYYFYKANWTTNPMVYITGHTFTNRLTNKVTAKVYANCDTVQLLVNGLSQGSQTSTNCIYTWPVSLLGGSNSIVAVGTKGASNVTDSLSWFLYVPAPVVSVFRPVGSAAWLSSTSLALLASVTVSNPLAGSQVSTTWVPSGGPGSVTLTSSNALDTIASFSSPGIYNLNFTAYNGNSTNINIMAIVNTDATITNGLEAWWKMDQTNSTVAVDSSGKGRNATIAGGVFTNGFISNALWFTSSTSDATYAAQQSNQVTVAAWVRSDTVGGGTLPVILGTPSFRLYFRFNGANTNTLAFATYDSVNGDFNCGNSAVGLGTWYHVAASYDRSVLPNRPTFYVNGRKMPTIVLTPPSGTPPPLSGTGYIGNSSATNRAWNGLIDDLRIYDRILSDAEVQVLAAVPPANMAPVVYGGTNQTVLWPAAAVMDDSITDDGKPNPPGIVTASWSQVSGPGLASFSRTNATGIRAVFSSPGNYILQLTADDGQAETASDVDIASVVQPAMQAAIHGGALQLSWNSSDAPWQLQAQTNSLMSGLGTNWINVPGAETTNQISIPINPSGPNVFYRLVSPW